MEIATTFTILLPADEAYRFLLDLERVAPCVPGGELGAAAADGTYPAKVTVRLGPMRLGYNGSLWISEQDDSSRRAVLRAKAHETGAQGTLEASMTMQVTPDGEGSRVDVATELALAGRAAKLGRGIVDDVARRLVAEMAACLEQRLGDQGTGQEARKAVAPPISGIKLLLRVVAERLGRIGRKGDR
jgi:carbon monoxide dehydrogenase subunit G